LGVIPADIEGLVGDFREGLHKIIDNELVAAYIFGSAVMEDFEATWSDVDFLVITESQLDGSSLQRLSELHSELAAKFELGIRLEGTYAARGQLHPWGFEGQVAVIQPGGLLNAAVTSEHGPGSLLAIRETGVAIVGEAAKDFLPEIDSETLIRGLHEYLERLVSQEDAEATEARELAASTLKIARCLHMIAYRRSSLKAEAAHWLARKQPELEPVLEAALAVRAGGADEHAANLLASNVGHFRAEARRLAKSL
jgi:predicted nucleotidyltransferase